VLTHVPLRQSWHTKTIVREFRRYYGAVQLPAPVPHGRTPEMHRADLAVFTRPEEEPPGFRAQCFRACQRSPTPSGLPAPRHCGGQGGIPRVRSASAPRPGRLRSSILCLHLPLSTLRTSRCQEAHMTRGQRGWLDLRCPRLLLFNTLPVYPGADPNRRVHQAAPITLEE
jgi:hypothetical protein